MSLRHRYYRFFVRLCCYPLPLLAFIIGAYIRSLSGSLGFPSFEYDRSFYLAVLVFTNIAWIIAAEHYQLCSIEGFFSEHTGIKKAAAACMATCTFHLGVLFFYRSHDLSRIFFTATAIAIDRGYDRKKGHPGEMCRWVSFFSIVATIYRASSSPPRQSRCSPAQY